MEEHFHFKKVIIINIIISFNVLPDTKYHFKYNFHGFKTIGGETGKSMLWWTKPNYFVFCFWVENG
jgi:hypothetical protein